MSSPLASPSQMSTQSGHTPGFLEAVKRLTTARETLKSAENARLKVLAIPLKRKGGGAARKQEAVTAYEAALKAYTDCQATVASYAKSEARPAASNAVQTTVLSSDSNGTSVAMEVDNDPKGSTDIEIDEDMAVEGSATDVVEGNDSEDGSEDGENVPDEGSDVEGDTIM
ncbi:hypothetical protein H0H92_009863, partial [Tricholoma furcatifolium]